MVQEKLLGKAKYHWFVYFKIVLGVAFVFIPVLYFIFNII